jgi:hypothetical protein
MTVGMLQDEGVAEVPARGPTRRTTQGGVTPTRSQADLNSLDLEGPPRAGSRDVLILHSRQPIGPGARAALRGRHGSAVRILTIGSPAAVLRGGLPPGWIIEPVAKFPRRSALDNADIVTNDEYALEECGDLRESVGLPRRLPAALAPWLDKITMKEQLRAASIGVPRAISLDTFADKRRDRLAEVLIDALGLPIVTKPRRGANNTGVTILQDRAALQAWLVSHVGELGWEAEEFLDAQLYHANALVRDGTVTPVIVGEYVRPLLALSEGLASGSITLPGDHPVTRIGEGLNASVAAALGAAGSFVMHTEFFVRLGQSFVIDVAARAPGALVPQIARAASGLNLERANFELQLNGRTAEPRATNTYGAWLWEPRGGQFRVPPSSRHRAFGDRIGTREIPALVAWSDDFDALASEIGARAGVADLGRT